MSYVKYKHIRRAGRAIPMIFLATILGFSVGLGARSCADAKSQQRINEYTNTLRASGEVGNINLHALLPFGDQQIVLTTAYTNAAKNLLSEEEYFLFLRSCYEPIQEINDLQIGYNLSLCSEDGSFGLPTPNNKIPIVNWTISTELGEGVIGQWVYKSNAFGEDYYYCQDPNTLNQINIPVGLETYVTETNINDLEYITVYGENYSTARLLANYKIFSHELKHSLAVDHIDKNVNVTKNEGGVPETYMTTKLNEGYVGDSKLDTNTLISAACLRKILNNDQNKNDNYFNQDNYKLFYELLEKGKAALNSQNNNEMN